MTRNGRQDEELGPDTVLDLESAEPVEFARDFHIAFVVPVKGDDITELDSMAKEQRVTAINAAEQLIREGLAARTASRNS